VGEIPEIPPGNSSTGINTGTVQVPNEQEEEDWNM